MHTRLLSRLLLIASGSAALTAGCGGQTTDETGQTSPAGAGAQAGTAGSGGTGGTGGTAGSGGSGGSGASGGSGGAGGAGGSSGTGGTAGTHGTGGSGGTGASAGSSGTGGATAGAGGAAAGAGGATAGAGGGCFPTLVCQDGLIVSACLPPTADPIPYTDCGNGVCVVFDQMCPGTMGFGGASGSSGEGGAAGAGAEGGAGGAAGSGEGGAGGAVGEVKCMLGAPCVEDSWCHYAETSIPPLHCVMGGYEISDVPPFDAKVCIDKTGACPTLDDPDLYTKVTTEFSWSCTGINGAAKPPEQLASNGAERCCYLVTSVCVGRPLVILGNVRAATLVASSAWT